MTYSTVKCYCCGRYLEFEEYTANHCTSCSEYVCDDCVVPDSRDDETGRCLCVACKKLGETK